MPAIVSTTIRSNIIVLVATNSQQNNLKELIVKYQPQIKSFVQKRVTNEDDAEDILQDIFYQFIKTLNTAMYPIENVSAWLYRVARNTIINAGIKKKEVEIPLIKEDNNDDIVSQDFSEVLFGDDQLASSPEVKYLRSLVWTELEAALSELPEEQREIFELTELDGIPVKEISLVSGVPVNTLLSRKHYAVVFLRKRLAALYEDIIGY